MSAQVLAGTIPLHFSQELALGQVGQAQSAPHLQLAPQEQPFSQAVHGMVVSWSLNLHQCCTRSPGV